MYLRVDCCEIVYADYQKSTQFWTVVVAYRDYLGVGCERLERVFWQLSYQ